MQATADADAHRAALTNFFAALGPMIEGAERAHSDSHEAVLTNFFAGLRPTVDIAKRAQAELDRRAATRFSLFDYFNERETDLSRVIGGLLDPAGTHGQGALFLRSFLDMVYRHLDDEALRSEFPHIDPSGGRVHLEYSTDKGRLIDIVLKMPGNRWIGIENKPWAGEQENQVRDYLAFLQGKDEKAWILYLSGDGSPSKTLPNDSEAAKRCPTVPYREGDGKAPSVERWVRQCWAECQAENVRWFLNDLLGYIRRQFQATEEDQLMTDNVIVRATSDFITSSEENLRLAFHVEEALQRVRESSRKLVLEGVQKRFSEEGWKTLLKPGHLTVWRESWFKHDNEDDQSGLLLEADSTKRWQDVYVGLYLSEVTRVKLEKAGLISTYAEKECDGYKSYMKNGYPAWKYLKDEWRDWSQVSFLKDAVRSDERDKMIGDLYRQLTELEPLGQKIAAAVKSA